MWANKMEEGYRFNDDVLVIKEDRKQAALQYPRVAYALDHPSLREWFVRADLLANAAKRRSRISGYLAVTLVAVALFVAAAEPLYGENHGAAQASAVVSAALGLAGALIGAFGLLHSGAKRRWLWNRQSTEQMRLFHFRTILELSDLVCEGRKEEFLQRREVRFRTFEEEVLSRPAQAFGDIVDRDWRFEGITPEVPAVQIPDGELAGELLAAYRQLRVQRQIDFCEYKLQKDGRLFSKFPSQQAIRLETASAVGLIGTILTHVFIVAAIGTGNPSWIGAWTYVLGMWLAITALALKTLQEGLQPNRETERYRHYRATLRAAAERFDTAPSVPAKLQFAAQVERAAADEMIIFLRAGVESRFLM